MATAINRAAAPSPPASSTAGSSSRPPLPSPSSASAAPTASAPLSVRCSRSLPPPAARSSLVFSLAAFLYFGMGIVSGPLADRWGPRRLAVFGMLLTGAGPALASIARSLAQVYAAYGLGVGLGVGLAYVPTLGAVQRWFTRRRGLASGLAVSGIGVGTLVMPPLASWCIARLGWRDAYLVLGLFAAALGAAAALLIDNDPQRRGLNPDGDPPRCPTVRHQSRGGPRSVGRSGRGASLACMPPA